MSTHSAVVDEVEIPSADAENGGPASFFERITAVVGTMRRDGSEIALPVKVRETQLAALATTGLALVHGVLALIGGLDCLLGSLGHFFAAWVTGGAALLFGLRSRWVWVAALGLTSAQTLLGVLTLVSAEMPTGVGPFTVLAGVMASGVVLALLLRRDCYSWFAAVDAAAAGGEATA
ncbi:hypothetical protein JK358_19575 [Nocardia sp. 2]|uniref:Uncharacterized protein n=1 Tax=Nocardia acididurans TaxID=2802282 RepID=A0ABS1M7I7_9NOCA|nr:hypothetical protein [Nocardia acididurans]MBL1076602.1 hypothetical protein [Nocardia acididurans]